MIAASAAAAPGVRSPGMRDDGLPGDYKPFYRRMFGEKRWYKIYFSSQKIMFGMKVFFNICETRSPVFNSFLLDAPGHSEWQVETNMDCDELLETLSSRQKILETHHLPYGNGAWAARYLVKIQ